MLHHLTQTFGGYNDRYFFGNGSKQKKLEQGDIFVWEPFRESHLRYGLGTKAGGILGQGSSVSNSSDGKENGVCMCTYRAY